MTDDTKENITQENNTQENPAPERTPLIIADEINQINYHSGKILLRNAIEIGRRLKEAKDLVKHGEWGRWLAESVRYSARSASRLIQLYEEYGSDCPLPTDDEACPISAALSDLTYTNALILIDLPPEQRERFAAANDITNMSSRELKQAVDSIMSGNKSAGSEPGGHKPAENECGKPSGSNELYEALQKINDLQSVLTVMVSTIFGLTRQVQSLEQRVEQLTVQLLSEKGSGSSRKKRRKYSQVVSPAGVQAAGSDSPTSAYTAASCNAASTASCTAVSTLTDPSASEYPKCTFSGFINADADYYIREGDSLFKLHLETIIKAFEQIMILLTALAKKDKDRKEVLRKRLKIALDNMSKTMNRWPPQIRIR